MPKCTINGKAMEVPEGTTIIQAMKQYDDQDIAHYCWHPGLSVAGVCRLCMVKIEGNPKLQIACNTAVTEGMVVSNQDAEVKDAVKWGLDFHLINHPLDCPICDQAGECGLQDQYMKFGKYDPEMAEQKVKKHKVVDLGPRVVLDSERCILCSRCVRFTEEVSKTNELGIFNRGDRSEIGTYDGKPLDNNYSVNTVDVCPVGALTSKDFRFKQRVWFLKNTPSVCPGCSTGCNISVYHNREGLWRNKPRFNQNINGYWMCDVGRDTYKYTNPYETQTVGPRGQERVEKAAVRLMSGKKRVGQNWVEDSGASIAHEAAAVLKSVSQRPEGLALVVTGQQTTEELEAMVRYFVEDLNNTNVYYWINNPDGFDAFDGLLYRGDHNPNTKGILKILEKYGLQKSWAELQGKLQSGTLEAVVVFGPENQAAYPDFSEKVGELSKAKRVIWATACVNESLEQLNGEIFQIPLRTFAEKSGTFTNYQGIDQKISPVMVTVNEALTGQELASILKGEGLSGTRPIFDPDVKVNNEFLSIRGEL